MNFYTQDAYYIKEEDIFSLRVKGNLILKETIETPCYDAEGNFMFTHSQDKRVDRYGDVLLRKGDDQTGARILAQIDFKFYIIPVLSDEPRTVDGCQDIIQRFKKYGLKGMDLHHSKYDYLGGKFDKKDYGKNRFFSELCFRGSRDYDVVKESPLALRKFEITEYKKHKDEFIKMYPDWEEEVTRLFETNIKLVALFYFTTPEAIKLNSYNKLAGALKRLNLKITNLKKK